MTAHTFRAGFLFCGLGAGALGFLEAAARLGSDEARFVNVGGVDVDADACADFEHLTGGRALQADVATLTPAELCAAWGDEAPDCVFSSPPCKGFSRLLSTKSAETAKYQALNNLVKQGLFLLCETWPTPPATIVVENVPGIMSRGAGLLMQVRQLLRGYGYEIHEATHDCGEVGGLAQHRRRYLLVARLPSKVSGYVYKPPKQRVKACGSVLETLPLPGDRDAGDLHKLPKLSWLNWVRLALIPAGKDWRALPKDAGELSLRITAARADAWKGRPGLFGVQPWNEPSPAVTGTVKVSGGCGRGAVADPRVALAHEPRPGAFEVGAWDEPARTVRGQATVRQAPAAVADPRLFSPVPEGEAPRTVFARFDVRGWEEPARTVAGSGSNGGYGVADPRVPVEGERRRGSYGVTDWRAPARTVTGESYPSNGSASVADPRLTCCPRAGAYGVMSWWEAASTVTGSLQVDNGRAAVADPREPSPGEQVVIISEDGTWHRPITTLELAALQGLPARVNGQPLRLAGRSVARWRERIGNAVPVGAARAVGETILRSLLASALGTWFLSATAVWVRDDGLTEDDELSVEERAA